MLDTNSTDCKSLEENSKWIKISPGGVNYSVEEPEGPLKSLMSLYDPLARIHWILMGLWQTQGYT